jgi:murein L,D-transpeptidase YcbB/YkuD
LHPCGACVGFHFRAARGSTAPPLRIAPLLLALAVLLAGLPAARVIAGSESPPGAALTPSAQPPTPSSPSAQPPPGPARPGLAPSVQAQNELRTLIGAGTLVDLRWPNFADFRDEVGKFYAAGGYSPAWVSGGRPSPQARAMIQLFKQAALKGLSPEDYDGSRWDVRLAKLGQPAGIDDAHFDLALTVCAMRYISALHIGRVNPRHFKFGLVGPKRYDLPHLLRNSIIGAEDVGAALAMVEPQYAGYKRAEAALAVYSKLAQAGDTAPLPIPAKSVHPGDAYPPLPRLIQRLRQLGDLPSDSDLPSNSAPPAQAPVYDGAVVDAVKHFQRRHGLDIDGVLGRQTVGALNTPLSQRVRQLQFTLERYRWIPRSFPQPPIVVNIPEFRLRTMRRQPAYFLTMKVVVGKAYGHHTPVFADYMRYVIFRPYWNVPLSIQRAELVPKIRRDPDYLAEHQYEVVDRDGGVITDDRVSADILSALRSGELNIRQKPGPENALDLVKFIFPNNYNVYLHGTPVTELFSHARRDFSHGCIRVEHPVALAEWVLRNNPGWTEDRIRAAMNGDRTFQVNLAKPIPVLILYSTAWVEPDGEVRFFADIYGYDAELERALAAGYPYPA